MVGIQGKRATRNVATQRDGESYIVILHNAQHERQQFRYYSLDDVVEFIHDACNADNMKGGIAEVVWNGNVIATYNVHI